MTNLVVVEIAVSEEAANLLRDPGRRERVGRLVSDLVHPESPVDDPLAALVAEVKGLARADRLTDADIEAELAAYNAENRL